MNGSEDVKIKGLYTTTIPLGSLVEYDFDCNKSEVNVMITKALIKSTFKVAAGCKSISVVSNGFLWRPGDSGHTLVDGCIEECRLLTKSLAKPLVEVSFDLYERKRRVNSRTNSKAQVRDSEDDNDDDDSDDDNDSISTSEELFGKVVKKPYLHYIISSHIDYAIEDIPKRKYESILVRNTSHFKGFYGPEQRIFVSHNGTILFCGCHLYPEYDSIIQPSKLWRDWKEDGKEDDYRFDYELPNKPFKHLFKFIGQIATKARDVRVNNFEIRIRVHKDVGLDVDNYNPECFKVCNISFNKLIPSSVNRQIEYKREAERRELLKLNFDRKDDWSNVKQHCHLLNEHHEGLMVLPEFRVNHSYYSTHIIYESIEPLSKSEHLPYEFGKPIHSIDMSEGPSSISKAYDYLTTMIESCKIGGKLNDKLVTQSDILKKLWELVPGLYDRYLEGEFFPVFKTDIEDESDL